MAMLPGMKRPLASPQQSLQHDAEQAVPDPKKCRRTRERFDQCPTVAWKIAIGAYVVEPDEVIDGKSFFQVSIRHTWIKFGLGVTRWNDLPSANVLAQISNTIVARRGPHTEGTRKCNDRKEASNKTPHNN